MDREQNNLPYLMGKKSADSLVSGGWKEFLSAKALATAWQPPEGSLYGKFFKTKLIDSIGNVKGELFPRFSDEDLRSASYVGNMDEKVIGRDCAIILDSGGSHSVAMSLVLAQRGYQPVIMFDRGYLPGGQYPENELGSLLYFASEISTLKAKGVVHKDSPPVFVLQAHRSHNLDENFDYSLRTSDFPDARQLESVGIKKLVYLNEGDQDGRFTDKNFQSIERVQHDLVSLIKSYESAGIRIFYTGISPVSERGSRPGSYFRQDSDSERYDEKGRDLLSSFAAKRSIKK